MADTVELIGKEANRWEEQVYLGDNQAQIVYGWAPEDAERQQREVLESLMLYALAQLVRMTGLEKSTLQRARRNGRPVKQHRTLCRLGCFARPFLTPLSKGVVLDDEPHP